MTALRVLPGGRDDSRDPAYWLHPVHGRKVLDAHLATDKQPPYMAQLAASVIAEAVKRNDRSEPQAAAALTTLAAYFNTDDDCNPHGIRRPDGVA